MTHHLMLLFPTSRVEEEIGIRRKSRLCVDYGTGFRAWVVLRAVLVPSSSSEHLLTDRSSHVSARRDVSSCDSRRRLRLDKKHLSANS